jgi:hypothetical protein
MERIKQQKKTFETRKKRLKLRQKEFADAQRIIASKGHQYNPKAKMNQKKTKFIPNWTIVELKTMIKWKAPKRPNIPTVRDRLVEVWNEVKDLDPPPLEDQWKQQDEDELAKFESDGTHAIERLYIMRRAEKRRKETLAAQLKAAQTRTALKVIGHVVQSLSESDRLELLENWEEYTLDDDYSLSSVSCVESVEIERANASPPGDALPLDESDDDTYSPPPSEEEEEYSYSYSDENGDYGATNVFGLEESEESEEEVVVQQDPEPASSLMTRSKRRQQTAVAVTNSDGDRTQQMEQQKQPNQRSRRKQTVREAKNSNLEQQKHQEAPQLRRSRRKKKGL